MAGFIQKLVLMSFHLYLFQFRLEGYMMDKFVKQIMTNKFQFVQYWNNYNRVKIKKKMNSKLQSKFHCEFYSKVYGGAIRFCQNNDNSFITDTIDSKLHNKSTKPLHLGHSEAPKYVKAVARLFSQINISESNLWIIPTIGKDSVRIYFSDPIVFPVSTCCDKCVYIDIETNLNGSIICLSCKMVLVSFIHYSDVHNQFGDLHHVDKHALFRQNKQSNDMKNRLMYENLTSNKFKTKNLKKVLLHHSKITEHSKITQQNFKLGNTGDSSVSKKPKDQKQKDPNKGNKDGFILQIKASLVKENKCRNEKKYLGLNSATYKNELIASKCKQEQKKQFDHQSSIEETRKIIMDIFR